MRSKNIEQVNHQYVATLQRSEGGRRRMTVSHASNVMVGHAGRTHAALMPPRISHAHAILHAHTPAHAQDGLEECRSLEARLVDGRFEELADPDGALPPAHNSILSRLALMINALPHWSFSTCSAADLRKELLHALRNVRRAWPLPLEDLPMASQAVLAHEECYPGRTFRHRSKWKGRREQMAMDLELSRPNRADEGNGRAGSAEGSGTGDAGSAEVNGDAEGATGDHGGGNGSSSGDGSGEASKPLATSSLWHIFKHGSAGLDELPFATA